MVPEFVQLTFAYLLVVIAIGPAFWARLRPGQSLAARQMTIVAEIVLRVVGFVVSYTIILPLAGDEIEPMLTQAGEAPLIAWTRHAIVEGGLPLATTSGLALGLGVLRAGWLWRRTKHRYERLGFVMWHETRSMTTPITHFHWPPESAITASQPRSVAELITRGVLGSVVVGVTEELLFRVGLPALLLRTSGNLWLSVIVSLAAFALCHAYQGWEGIADAALLGTVFMCVYLATGYIVPAIILHVLNNIYALTVLPIVGTQAARREFDERMRLAERSI
ncbi:hypothetical protein B7R22_14860 [Subtercola boreus]|uniref:CAAX prenyl protease 2/Lysostaphin resistance protein A-like domain-containing protein n=1 Tax=Subtercola boreus TaxID=120213 RepID=A0A3E0VVH0_9MICO|nr:CPBP family intramembrane glutamic endopeptidase [Subtercola boreus]RFA12827.1 hypothetical protein B7R22_14860 [Subtercola boreus]